MIQQRFLHSQPKMFLEHEIKWERVVLFKFGKTVYCNKRHHIRQVFLLLTYVVFPLIGYYDMIIQFTIILWTNYTMSLKIIRKQFPHQVHYILIHTLYDQPSFNSFVPAVHWHFNGHHLQKAANAVTFSPVRRLLV